MLGCRRIAAPPTVDAERFEHVGCPRFDRAGAVGMVGALRVCRVPGRVLAVGFDRATGVAYSWPPADTEPTTLTFFVTDFDEPSTVDEFGYCGISCATIDDGPCRNFSGWNKSRIHAVSFDAFDLHLRHDREHHNLIYGRHFFTGSACFVVDRIQILDPPRPAGEGERHRR